MSQPLCDPFDHFIFPRLEVAGKYVSARFLYEPQIKCKIMYRGYLHAEYLLRCKQMPYISLRIEAVHIARTIFLKRRKVVGPLLVAHVHDAMCGKQHTVTSVARRHDTVHHVDTAFYRLKYIGGCTHPHKVARLIGRQYVVYHLDNILHDFSGFTHGQSAYGISVSAEVSYKLSRLSAKVRISTPLHYWEIGLLMAI